MTKATTILRSSLVLSALLFLLSATLPAQTVQTNGTGGGNWDSTATWQGGVVPDSLADVIIVSGDSVNLRASITSSIKVNSLTIQTNAKLANSFSTATVSLSVTGAFEIDSLGWYYGNSSSVTSWPSAASYSIHNASYYVQQSTGSSTIGAVGRSTFGNLINAKTGSGSVCGTSLTIYGDLTVKTGATGTSFKGTNAAMGNATHHVYGNLRIVSGQFCAVDAPTADGLTGIWNVDGNVTVGDSSTAPTLARFGPFASADGGFSRIGIINIGGDLKVINGARLQGGSSTGSSATTEFGEINLRGNLTMDSTAITATNSKGRFALNFVGSGTQTVTLKSPLKFSSTNANALLTVNDTIAPTSHVVVTGGRSWYSSSIGAPNGDGLFLVQGSISFGPSDTLMGLQAFTLEPGTTLMTANPFGLDTNGSIQVKGMQSLSTGANYSFMGTAAQVTGGQLPTQVNNLTIDNAAGVELSATDTVNGTLALTNGILYTGGKSVYATGAVSRGSGHVCGNLDKPFGPGPIAKTFEIGDSTRYAPIDIAFNNVGTGGNLTAKTLKGSHPAIAFAGIDPKKMVHRYYTLSNSGIVFNSYDATFHFDSADVDSGADPGIFLVKKYDGANWTAPALGARNLTSTGIMNEGSFSDFAIGKELPPDSFTIVSTAGAGGSVLPLGTLRIKAGESIVYHILPDQCFQIDSVFVDSVYAGRPDSVPFTTVIRNHTVSATFSQIYYTVSVIQGAHGSITPDTTVVKCGDSLRFTVTPEGCYHLDSLFVDGSYVKDSTTGYTFRNVSASHTITAKFAIDVHTLTITAVNGNVVTHPHGTVFDCGDTVELTAHPHTGYLFSSWSGDTSGSANPLTITMTADKSVTANFALDPLFEVTYRSFRADSLALELDNKGKPGKYVQRKPVTCEFALRLFKPAGASSITLKFSMDVVGGHLSLLDSSGAVISVAPVSGKTSTVSLPGISRLLLMEGTGNKGKKMKTTYAWATLPKATKGTVADTSYSINQPRLPMPNRVNALYETFYYAGYGAPGMVVGLVSTYDPKHLGWFQTTKYGDALKTLNTKGNLHSTPAHGLDNFTSGKPLIKQQKSLPATKYNNKLLADMIALRLNIVSSAMGITPKGLGELVYVEQVTPQSFQIPLTAQEGTGTSTTLHFGLDPAATDGLDDLLGEHELPPPFIPFDARFVNRPGRFDLGYGTYLDLRGFSSGVKLDTFVVRAKPELENTLVTFSWPEGLNMYTDYMRMVDNEGGSIVNVNMLTTHEVTVLVPVSLDVYVILRQSSITPLSGKMIKEIASYGDSLMMGWLVDSTYMKGTKSITVKAHHFAGADAFATLGDVVARIDSAFEGPLDTVKFSDSLIFKGYRRLLDVPFLTANPGVAPATIVPLANVYSEQDPVAFELRQNYPNPFNPTTTIQFDLPVSALVTLKVYNILGQEVATLLDREMMDEGTQEVMFDASNHASGVYFYRMVAEPSDQASAGLEKFQTVKKMMLIK